VLLAICWDEMCRSLARGNNHQRCKMCSRRNARLDLKCRKRGDLFITKTKTFRAAHGQGGTSELHIQETFRRE
jgi:hypothetical protein